MVSEKAIPHDRPNSDAGIIRRERHGAGGSELCTENAAPAAIAMLVTAWIWAGTPPVAVRVTSLATLT